MPRIRASGSRASLGSLGDDTLGVQTPTQQLTEVEWRSRMLAKQDELIEQHKHWADGDKFQKWVAIGATLAIPLSAAIWRALGIGRRRRDRR